MDDLFTRVLEAQYQQLVSGVFVPRGADEQPAATFTGAGYESPALTSEGLQKTIEMVMPVRRPTIQVVESEWCTITEECTRARTWRERLFSWPWRPFLATAVDFTEVPSPQLYLVDTPAPGLRNPFVLTRPLPQKVLVGHPVTIAAAREQIEQEGVELIDYRAPQDVPR